MTGLKKERRGLQRGQGSPLLISWHLSWDSKSWKQSVMQTCIILYAMGSASAQALRQEQVSSILGTKGSQVAQRLDPGGKLKRWVKEVSRANVSLAHGRKVKSKEPQWAAHSLTAYCKATSSNSFFCPQIKSFLSHIYQLLSNCGNTVCWFYHVCVFLKPLTHIKPANQSQFLVENLSSNPSHLKHT